ncbi:hypothetical protein J4G37_60095, partial [Microvirga sp. 3-52]|nr:hypothetical protein [Microvirga sp. 3-52]
MGGFVKENVVEGIFEQADCAIYSCEVTTEEYIRMQIKIRQIELTKELYRYNFIGLFAVAINKDLQRKHAFFCSQFVATVVNDSGIKMFAIKPNL